MAEGFITEIRQSEGRFGPSYQIFIDGKNMGFVKYPPKGVAQGDFVSYETEQKGQYLNLKAGTLSKKEAPQGIKPPERSAITKDKQDVISGQSALNSALAFVKILVDTDSLPVAKGAKAKQADLIKAVLLEYMAEFYELNTGTPFIFPEGVDPDAVAAQSWDEQE